MALKDERRNAKKEKKKTFTVQRNVDFEIHGTSLSETEKDAEKVLSFPGDSSNGRKILRCRFSAREKFSSKNKRKKNHVVKKLQTCRKKLFLFEGQSVDC